MADPMDIISERCGIRCTRLSTIPSNGLYVVDACFEDSTRLKVTGLTNESAWATFWKAAKADRTHQETQG